MESRNKTNKYNIEIGSEREFWKRKVLMKLILYDTKCPSCNAYTLKLKNIKSICNPYKLQCNKAKCKKNVSIRKNTLMSILINAIELFLLEEKMQPKLLKL